MLNLLVKTYFILFNVIHIYIPTLLGGSVLIQILFSALYTKLIEATKEEEPVHSDVVVPLVAQKTGQKSSTAPNRELSKLLPPMSAKASICNILAEAICSIDEDNKHTDAIQMLIKQTRESQRATEMSDDSDEDAAGLSLVSTVKLDDNLVANGIGNPSPSTRTAEEYDVENAEYIAELLVSDVLTTSVGKQCMKVKRFFFVL